MSGPFVHASPSLPDTIPGSPFDYVSSLYPLLNTHQNYGIIYYAKTIPLFQGTWTFTFNITPPALPWLIWDTDGGRYKGYISSFSPAAQISFVSDPSRVDWEGMSWYGNQSEANGTYEIKAYWDGELIDQYTRNMIFVFKAGDGIHGYGSPYFFIQLLGSSVCFFLYVGGQAYDHFLFNGNKVDWPQLPSNEGYLELGIIPRPVFDPNATCKVTFTA